MALTAQGIEAKVRSLTERVVARDGYDLVDVAFQAEAGGWALTLFIDKPGGVNLEDCERVSRVVESVLDVEDPIPHRYNLQVSSPGLERPLRRDGDYLAAEGRLVKIVTREPISGQRVFSGRLVRAAITRTSDNGSRATHGSERMTVCVFDEEQNREQMVPVEIIKKAILVYEQRPHAPEQSNRKRKRQGGKNR
ncbi:MAG: ribosome maturation factor RimP [Acidobacteriota bacterium]